MSEAALTSAPSRARVRQGSLGGRLVERVLGTYPILAVSAVLVAVWYGGAIYYNTGALKLHYEDLGTVVAWQRLGLFQRWSDALNMNLPLLPAPHQVLADFFHRLLMSPAQPGNLWVDISATGSEAILGFLLGTVVGILLAFVFVRSRILEISLFPYVVMSQTVPIVALVPALVVALGLGLRAKVLVAAYLAFYPVTISAVKGLRSIDPRAYELMRSYAASGRQTFFKLRLPAALPYVFTGMKIGVTASLIGAIISELPVGSPSGFGRAILDASQYDLNIPLWSTILGAGLMGVVLYVAVALLERLIVRHRPDEA